MHIKIKKLCSNFISESSKREFMPGWIQKIFSPGRIGSMKSAKRFSSVIS